MQHPDLFDYAPHLLAIDRLAKELHDACLNKNYTEVPQMCSELVVETRMLRAWAMHQLEESHGNRD